MESNFFIKYKGASNNAIDLEILGESIIGFSKVINEIVEISGIKGEVSVKATKIRNGSIVVDILVELFTSLPFENIADYLDFLKVVGGDIYKEAVQEFSDGVMSVVDIERKINDHFISNPVRFYLLTRFIEESIKWVALQKKRPTTIDKNGNNLPKKYVPKFKKLISQKKFKKALHPIIEDKVSEIELSTKPNFETYTSINLHNFGEYLNEDEQVLPDYENGSLHKMTGKIVSLQSSRGESMKFQADKLKTSERLLIGLPADGKKTEDFLQFYKKKVIIEVEIYRKSMYQKPKLIINEISLLQTEIKSD